MAGLLSNATIICRLGKHSLRDGDVVDFATWSIEDSLLLSKYLFTLILATEPFFSVESDEHIDGLLDTLVVGDHFDGIAGFA